MNVVKDLTRVWSFLNGKKTYICTAAATVYWALIQAGAVQPNHTVEVAIAFGISVGLIHKAYKAE